MTGEHNCYSSWGAKINCFFVERGKNGCFSLTKKQGIEISIGFVFSRKRVVHILNSDVAFPEKEKPNCHSDIWHCHFNREDIGNCFNFCFNFSIGRLLFQFSINGQVGWTNCACTLCNTKIKKINIYVFFLINYGPVQQTFYTVLEKSIPPLHVHMKLIHILTG